MDQQLLKQALHALSSVRMLSSPWQWCSLTHHTGGEGALQLIEPLVLGEHNRVPAGARHGLSYMPEVCVCVRAFSVALFTVPRLSIYLIINMQVVRSCSDDDMSTDLPHTTGRLKAFTAAPCHSSWPHACRQPYFSPFMSTYCCPHLPQCSHNQAERVNHSTCVNSLDVGALTQTWHSGSSSKAPSTLSTPPSHQLLLLTPCCNSGTAELQTLMPCHKSPLHSTALQLSSSLLCDCVRAGQPPAERCLGTKPAYSV